MIFPDNEIIFMYNCGVKKTSIAFKLNEFSTLIQFYET